MIIIRNNRMDHPREQRILERNIRFQAINGLIVLPEYCELLHTDPGENNVTIFHHPDPDLDDYISKRIERINEKKELLISHIEDF